MGTPFLIFASLLCAFFLFAVAYGLYDLTMIIREIMRTK